MKKLFFCSILFSAFMALVASSAAAQSQKLPEAACQRLSGMPELKGSGIADPKGKLEVAPEAKTGKAVFHRVGVKINTVSFDVGDVRPIRQNVYGFGKDASCWSVSLMLRF